MNFFDTIINCDDILEFTRNDIILKKDTYYFDWTASGLESKAIKHRLDSILPIYANTHSNTSKHANLISNLYKEAKIKIKESLGLEEDFFIIPSGFGATSAMKKYQEIFGIYAPPRLKERINISTINEPLMVIGPYEHHSNEISLRESICKCVRIPLNGELIDIEYLQKILDKNKDKEILASINIASNVSGIVLPYNEISRILKQYNANIAFDLASFSPHKNIDSHTFDVAFISPHKILGGIGSCGILCIRNKYFDINTPPTFGAGGSIKYASKDTHYYIDDIESREDVGTPPILELFKTALAYKYRDEVGLDYINKREKILSNIFISELKSIQGVEIYGINNNAERIPTISFNIQSISPYDLAYELSYKYNIQVRAGCSCASSYGHDLLNRESIKDINELSKNPNLKPSWIRVSLHYSHNFNDIEYLLDSIKKVKNRLGK